jgi:hypothetical protein
VLSNTEVALWSGANSGATQGFVVGWTNIDPGSDGVFALRSEQYVGAIPVSVDPGGVANDSKGYALTAVRLEAISRSQPVPGDYRLVVQAAGSGIRDAVGNWLAADASVSFLIDTQPPTVAIQPVAPNPRVTPVEQVVIVFNEPVTGLDLADLRLSRNGGANLLTAAQTLNTADNIRWTLGNLGSLTATPGSYTLTLSAAGSGIVDRLGYALQTGAETSWTTLPSALVVGEYLFYNNSAFDGGNPAANANDDQAIAPNKFALRPGDPQATFANYTSFTRGINGVMIDIQGLLGTPTLATVANFFQFRVGNTLDTATWVVAPAPEAVAVRPAPGQPGVSRVSIVWPDGAIANCWLEVTVLANLNTGLAAPDKFYFGNLVGETGAAPTAALVTVEDEDAAWAADSGFKSVAITNPYDFNRDRRVTLADALAARQNDGASLVLLQLPPAGQGLTAADVDPSVAPCEAEWSDAQDLCLAADATGSDSGHAELLGNDVTGNVEPLSAGIALQDTLLFVAITEPTGPSNAPADADPDLLDSQYHLEANDVAVDFAAVGAAVAYPVVAATIDNGGTSQPDDAIGTNGFEDVAVVLGGSRHSVAMPDASYFKRYQADRRADGVIRLPDTARAAREAAFAQTDNGHDAIGGDLWALSVWDWLEPLVRSNGGKRRSSLVPGQQKAEAVDVVLSAEAW